MEVRIVGLDGTLPDGCFIAVRVGDMQKQTQYDPKKVYRFPEARRSGKVEIFKRIGTCDLVWNAEEPETRTCRAISATDDYGIKLQLSMVRVVTNITTDGPSSLSGAVAPAAVDGDGDVVDPLPKAKASKREVTASAKKYLQEHDVEGILTGAMRALLKAMPSDAAAFLCDYIQRQYRPRTKDAPEANLAPMPQCHPFSGFRCLDGCLHQANCPNCPSVQDSAQVEEDRLKGIRRAVASELLTSLQDGRLENLVRRSGSDRNNQDPSLATSPAEANPDPRREGPSLAINPENARIDELRAKAAKSLSAGVITGALEDALQGAKGDKGAICPAREADSDEDDDCLRPLPTLKKTVPNEASLEDLRANAFQYLTAAVECGTLMESLQPPMETHNSEPSKLLVEPSREKEKDTELLTVEACQQADPETKGLDEIRSEIGNAMITGAAEGSVEKAIKPAKDDPPGEKTKKGNPKEFRGRMARSMIASARDGSLKRMIDSSNNDQQALDPAHDKHDEMRSNLDEMRKRLATSLLTSAQNGTLQEAIRSASSTQQAAGPEGADRELAKTEEIRRSLADSLITSVRDGSLEELIYSAKVGCRKPIVPLVDSSVEGSTEAHGKEVGALEFVSQPPDTGQQELFESPKTKVDLTMRSTNLSQLKNEVRKALSTGMDNGRLVDVIKSVRCEATGSNEVLKGELTTIVPNGEKDVSSECAHSNPSKADGSKQKELEDLRVKVAANLINGVTDGSLEGGLNGALRVNGSKQKCSEESVLRPPTNAGVDVHDDSLTGALDNASNLNGSEQRNLEELRGMLAANLITCAKDGSLEGALNSASKARGSKRKELEDLREKLATNLIAGVKDGSLEGALSNTSHKGNLRN